MKKILIILAAVTIIVIILLLIFQKNSSSDQVGSTGNTTGGLPPVATSTPPYVPPAGSTLIIGTPQGSVAVNNFYNNSPQISADHTAVLIAQTDSYNITYYAPDSSFNILITKTPFETVRAQAENAFLKALNISQTDVCKLKVEVAVPVSVDPNYAGQNMGLSFCSTGTFQQ